MKILVTGSAGFIGFHLVQRLLSEGHEVVGLDNINDYYDPQLKLDRLKEAGIAPDEMKWKEEVQSSLYQGYRFVRMTLEDKEGVDALFNRKSFHTVVNLAAQAGVRYSLENPEAYVQSNVVGYLNILEACRHHKTPHLIYASSSSVYGNSTKMPLSVDDRVDHPISLYAATKKSNELMAYTYSHLFGLPTTGLRFFTVYGPWGRPDMAPILFANAITKGEPIKVFNEGKLERDFTYIEDIVEGILRICEKGPVQQEGEDHSIPYAIYNIGNGQPVALMDFIHTMEEALGEKARKKMMPMQAGDVYKTFADVAALKKDYGYAPSTSLKVGIGHFVEWFRDYGRLVSGQ